MRLIDRIPVKALSATTNISTPLHRNPPGSNRALHFADQSGRLHVEVEPAPWVPDATERLNDAAANGALRLVVGDYTEPGVSTIDGPCANAVLIDVDLVAGRVRALSSLVGLPPITVWRNSRQSSLSCPFLPSSISQTDIDIEGIADTLRWGHPLDGRTLFKEVSIVPPHSSVTLEENRTAAIIDIPADDSTNLSDSLDAPELIEAQISAMLSAAARMPISDSFLSLSGGLDSRTALVALVTSGCRLQCVSMAGSPHNLDANLASQFCAATGLPHQIVLFGDEYMRRLPDLAQRSAALTGGISCLSQTVDLYLYSQLNRTFHARISGHLGNQVGRGGVESIAAAAVDDRIFSDVLRRALLRRPIEPWFVPRISNGRFSAVLFEQEVHYWSIANYMLGCSNALQLSPYADVRLIELSKTRFDRDPQLLSPTRVTLRRRDIRHRLLGPPRQESFQRAILNKYAAAGRNVPLNWGWLASGGWSIRGGPAALRFAADALAHKLGRQYKPLKTSMARISRAIGNPSELVAWPEMLRGPLRSLIYDVLLSRQTIESGLFEVNCLRQVLAEHYEDGLDHSGTLYRALELALGLTAHH